MDLVSTSCTPADSSTARTPPPAIRPVPGDAGLSMTRAGAELPDDRMRDRSVDDRHQDDVLLRVVDALGDRIGHFVGLAQADAHMPLAVAHHHDRVEAEPATALHHFGDAVDVDELVLEFQFTCFDSCHRVLVTSHMVTRVSRISLLSGEESNLYSRLQRPLSCH